MYKSQEVLIGVQGDILPDRRRDIAVKIVPGMRVYPDQARRVFPLDEKRPCSENRLISGSRGS